MELKRKLKLKYKEHEVVTMNNLLVKNQHFSYIALMYHKIAMKLKC